MAAPVTVTDISFRTEVIESEVPTLVFFWASWNSTCKGLAPSINLLAAEDGEQLQGGTLANAGVGGVPPEARASVQLKVCKLDVEANPVIPSMFGVTMVPTLMLFRGGQALTRTVGYRRIEVLRAEIEAALVGV